jgi:hypothetical protein
VQPGGFPKGRRAQLEACEAAAREHSSEAIETLVTLMRHSLDDRVRLLAADKLLERGFGRPNEYDPDKDLGREGLAARLETARQPGPAVRPHGAVGSAPRRE